MAYRELNKDDLEIRFEWIPEFKTTKEIVPYRQIIGQDNALNELYNGLMIQKNDYNIFICGESGTGKMSFASTIIKEFAKKRLDAYDWCHVYNFKNGTEPVALCIEADRALDFKNDVEKFIKKLFEDMPDFISNPSYYSEKNIIMEKYQDEILKITEVLYKEAKENGFNVRASGEGFAFVPIIDNQEMTEKEYNDISKEEREGINNKVLKLKNLAINVIKESQKQKKAMEIELDTLLKDAAKREIEGRIIELNNKYIDNNDVIKYLNELKDDILNNINIFVSLDSSQEIDENILTRYGVNVIVSNKKNSGAPVIIEEHPDYQGLFGRIEYENKGVGLYTDFTKINSGTIHYANGGYLILNAYNLISGLGCYDGLKRMLKMKKICIDNFKNAIDIIPMSSIKPMDIPLNLKVILVGSSELYYLLYNYDEEFKELFKIKCEFEDKITNNEGNGVKLLGFISRYCIANNIPSIDRNAAFEILKYLLKITGERKYFSGSLNKITELMDRAGAFAVDENKSVIDKTLICRALDSINSKGNKIKKAILDMYLEGKYIVNLDGYKIGEINGLSVLDFGDFIYGKQNKITAATFAGHEGVVNIEREINLSGSIHNKGIMILAGYIGENFGQDIVLSFNASICFEQLYGEIEGDSASAAELIALMSSLGDIPINQSIAVTGSVNQKGDIQPVGGINEKIEGYYDISKLKGFNGNHGVIIPEANINELVLKDEIVQSVKAKKYHIYSVKKIDDCFEILCDNYSKEHGNVFETVKDRIRNKLKLYNQVLNTGDKEQKIVK